MKRHVIDDVNVTRQRKRLLVREQHERSRIHIVVMTWLKHRTNHLLYRNVIWFYMYVFLQYCYSVNKLIINKKQIGK